MIRRPPSFILLPYTALLFFFFFFKGRGAHGDHPFSPTGGFSVFFGFFCGGGVGMGGGGGGGGVELLDVSYFNNLVIVLLYVEI